jgi:hypothetical protein
MSLEAVTGREGNEANTSPEKEKMVRCESLAPNVDDQYYKLSPTPSTYTRITELAVEQDLVSE